MSRRSAPPSQPPHEWFDQPDPELGKPGLRFECTQCGNCCSGPPGFVHFTEAEAAAMAGAIGIEPGDFYEKYTEVTPMGRSLRERLTRHGYDCVFLDRETIPGKAICRVYADRPAQCRTWPFWKSNLRSRNAWESAKRTCPGMDQGPLIPPEQIRIQRARSDA